MQSGIQKYKLFLYSPLGQYRIDDFSRKIGQAIVSPLGREGEFLVIDAKEVEQRGMEVIDVNGVVHCGVSEFIRAQLHPILGRARLSETTGVAALRRGFRD